MTTPQEHLVAIRALVEPYARTEPDADPKEPWAAGKQTYRSRLCAVADYACKHWAGDFLEVGCYGGDTTIRLAGIAKAHGRRVLAVDNWRPGTEYALDTEVYPSFLKTIAPWRDVIDVLEADCHLPETRAAILARGPFAFVFVDDGHEDAEQLFDNVTGLMASRGVCVVDDVFMPSTRRTIDEARVVVPGWSAALYVDRASEAYMVREGA